MAGFFAAFQSQSQRDAQHEQQLQERLATLQKQFDASQEALDQQKQLRAELDEKVQLAKARTEILNQQLASAKNKSGPGIFACFGSICSPSASQQIEAHYKQMQVDLAASKEALQKLEAQRLDLEDKHRSITMSLPERSSEFIPQRNSGFFGRTETPQRNRDLRTQIQDAMQDLSSLDEETRREIEARTQLEADHAQHSATHLALESQIRSLQRDPAVDAKLKAIAAGKADASSLTLLLQGKSTEEQQQLIAQINAFTAELEAAEVKTSDEYRSVEQVHREVSRKLSMRKGSDEPIL